MAKGEVLHNKNEKKNTKNIPKKCYKNQYKSN